MLFVNAPFRNNGAAFPYLPVLSHNLFFCAYPFARFVKEYAAGRNLNLRLGKQPPFAEDEVDVVIGLSLVVMERRHAFHIIPPAEFLREIFQHLLRLVLRVGFGQGDNQLPCFNTFTLCAASLKLLLAFSCEVAPKGMVCGAVGGIEVFLFGVACDIRYSSPDIGQL